MNRTQLIIVVCLSLLLAFAVSLGVWKYWPQPETPIPPVLYTQIPGLDPSKEWYGLCGPYQAQDIESFLEALRLDPELEAFYNDFDVANAHVITVGEQFQSHVAYKKNGEIAVTKKTVVIRKGEKLLTDGKTTVRGFCCNKMHSVIPPGSIIRSDEPKAADLNPPELKTIMNAKLGE